SLSVTQCLNVQNPSTKYKLHFVRRSKDAYKHGNPSEDVFVLVAGDADYVPTINELKADGYFVEVVFWDHASKELKDAASRFIGLNKHLEHLRL
ncbi:MAG: NYN domain-containing protein, partial [Burkholderiales bacterium]|nr:NYN domain-containing protein [Burkholderiales bacterium]